jgi:hypothetical protein
VSSLIRCMLIMMLGLVCGQALAQSKTMYRCGNQFQERPCEGPKAKPVEAAKAAEPAAKPDPVAMHDLKERATQRANCDTWRGDLEDVKKRLKAGVVSAAVTDSLEKRRSELQSRIDASCYRKD